MLPTSPIIALAAAFFALALLFTPGWLLLRVVRIRGLLALALAPACSTAVLGCGAILAQFAGLAWTIPVAFASTALAVLLALAVRRLAPRAPRIPRLHRADRALIGLGLALAVIPSLVAMGSVDSYLQRWDAVFHLAALRFIDETGSASTLTLGALSYGDGHAAIYPAGWHALAALLPGSPTAVLTIGATVTSALPWVLGCAALSAQLARTVEFAPDRRVRGEHPTNSTTRGELEHGPGAGAKPSIGVAGVGGLLAGLVTATPMSLWTGWGHVPNAAALAMLPGVLALALLLARERAGRPVALVALGVALLGMGLAHPNAVLAVGVLALPALVGAVIRAARQPRLGMRVPPVVAPVLATLAVVGVLVVFLVAPFAAAVTGYPSDEIEPLGVAVLEVASGRYRLWPTAAGSVVAVLAIGGAVCAALRRQLLPALTLLLAWVLYVDASTGGLLQISRLWYTSPARLSVVVTVVAVPLAAGAVVTGIERLRGRAGTVVALATAAVLVTVIAVPSINGRTFRTVNVFRAEPGHPPQFVTTGELEMIADLPGVVDGAILGSPFSGAASVYGLTGLPVTFPVAGQVWSQDQQLVMDHLDQIASGELSPEVCDAVDRLQIRYLYQDSEPYQRDQRYEALDQIDPLGATLIAEGDTARVLELTPCDG